MPKECHMPKPQNFEAKNQKIRDSFKELKRKNPERLRRRLDLSWSNWGFGRESLADSAARLQRSGVTWIELHGNHYGPDLGYRVDETLRVLGDHGIRVAGVCGMFSADNDLSSNRAHHRQAAIDYLRREIPFTAAVGGGYLLVVPGAVGRPQPYDDCEAERSAETLRLVGDLFMKHKVRAAIEPIRAAEVSFLHTIADAVNYLAAVAHPGVAHINGDVYHMQVEEAHIGEAIRAAGERLTNLHVADSNRCALGDGAMDVDTIIRSLYLIGFNREGCFVTPEPLGPGGDPYPAMHGRPDRAALDRLVERTATYFREREDAVLQMD
jgi:D-psicose/D-tagatose/L-ribulose 3-epimerase